MSSLEHCSYWNEKQLVCEVFKWRYNFCNSKCVFCFYCATVFYSRAKKQQKQILCPPLQLQELMESVCQLEHKIKGTPSGKQSGAAIVPTGEGTNAVAHRSATDPQGEWRIKWLTPIVNNVLNTGSFRSEPVGLWRRGPRGFATRPPSEAPGTLRPVRAEWSWGLTDGHAPFVPQGGGARGCCH